MSATTRRIATLRRVKKVLESEYADRKGNWTPDETANWSAATRALSLLIEAEQTRNA